MKTKLVITTLSIALLTSPSFAIETNNISHENVDEEAIGFGVGSVVGGILGGPVGFITGAFAGALVGDSVGSDKETQLLTSDLKQSNSTIDILQKNSDEQTHALKDAKTAIEQLLSENQELKQNALEFAVQFRTNSSDIEKHYQDQLARLVDILKKTPQVEIEVDGFADRIGDETYNMKLSGLRAAAVKEFLIQQGIDKKRVVAHAHGESKPIKPSESLENNFFDRRVTVHLRSNQLDDDTSLSVVSN